MRAALFCFYCESKLTANTLPCPRCGSRLHMLGNSGWGDAIDQGRGNYQTGQSTVVRTFWPVADMLLAEEWERPVTAPISFQEGQPSSFTPPPPSSFDPRQLSQRETAPSLPSIQPLRTTERLAPSSTPASQVSEDATRISADKKLQPAAGAEPAPVVIARSYKKPRTVIPAYRVLSGLFSLIVVSLLLCGGLGYYLHTSGAWDIVGRYVRPGPQPASTAGPNLADPPDQVDKGPAFATIPVATTTAQMRGGSAGDRQVSFKIDQTIYFVFTVQAPPTDGDVTVKWYSNDHLVGTPQQQHIALADGPTQQRIVTATIPTAGQGAVEVYWNDQLAQKLYFVVR